MPKSKINFEDYREKLEYYRLEFLKRSDTPEGPPWGWPANNYKIQRQRDNEPQLFKMEFLLSISRRATIEELESSLSAFCDNVRKQWDKRKIGTVPLNYLRDGRGVKYPFKTWDRLLALYDARQDNPDMPLKEIGAMLKQEGFYVCADSSLEVTVCADSDELEKLLRSAALGVFPADMVFD